MLVMSKVAPPIVVMVKHEIEICILNLPVSLIA